MGGRSRSASAGASKKVRQPTWAKYRGAWWWKDPKLEEDDWHPQEEFNQKDWNRAQAEPVETGAEKVVGVARRKAQAELQLARNSAFAAAKAWGHSDVTSQSLLAKLDALHDKKRAELDLPAHAQALQKELDSMESKLEDLALEASRISERLARIDEEQKYLQDRASVLQSRKDGVEEQIAAEGAGSTLTTPTVSTGVVTGGAGGSQSASSSGLAQSRIQVMEQQMASMSTQLAAVLGALSQAHGVPVAAPVGGGSWDHQQGWNQSWSNEDWDESWDPDGDGGATGAAASADMDETGGLV